MDDAVQWLFVCGLAVVGVGSVVKGVAGIRSLRALRSRAVHTGATVIGQQETGASVKNMFYAVYPVVEFAAGGATVRATVRNGTRSERWGVGERVAVFYDPDDPATAYVGSGRSVRTGPGRWLAIGALLLAGCVFVLLGMLGVDGITAG
ncbi:MAG: DUF3592 domain-containing protein [Streptosporangiales bacterium]